MKIAIGNDHTALEMKNEMKKFLEEKGYEVIDYGTNSTESCDYPVYGEKVGNAVANGEADLGPAICSEPYTAKLSRMHNDSNVLAFGARVIGTEMAKMITEEWLNAEYEGGRHQRRVDQVMDIERRNQSAL